MDDGRVREAARQLQLPETAAGRFAAFIARQEPETAAALVNTALADEAHARTVREVFTEYDGAGEATLDVIDLLRAAAVQRNDNSGVRTALERIGASGKNDLTRLAGLVGEAAREVVHPDSVFGSIVRWVLNLGIPMMSDDAFAGMARIAAAECRMNHTRQHVEATLAEEHSKAPLRQTETWRAMLRDDGPRDGFEALLKALSADDASDLVAACIGDVSVQARERELCLGLLTRLTTTGDARFDPAQRSRLGKALATKLREVPEPWRDATGVRLLAQIAPDAVADEMLRRYEKDGRRMEPTLADALLQVRAVNTASATACARAFGQIARAALLNNRPVVGLSEWVSTSPEEAERFLTGDLPPAGLSDTARYAVAYALLRLGGAPAISRLRQIQALGAEAGTFALCALEILGAEPPDRIDAMAYRWREERSGAALSSLYYSYIEKLPMGTPFLIWMERLGHTDRGTRSFWITPKEALAEGLFVELDPDYRLSGMSFK